MQAVSGGFREAPAEAAWPDVLALEAAADESPGAPKADAASEGGIAVADKPPQVSLTVTAEAEMTAMKQRTLVIPHATGDRIVALLEIVSPGNKSHRYSLNRFVDKAVSALRQDYHLLIVDLFAPGPYDPQGIHGAVWGEVDAIEAVQYQQPPGRPLTLVAYEAKSGPTAYIQPIAVGESLPAMPLFYRAGRYINVPLEETYQQAWRGVPQLWRQVVEGK